ncbi:hypothetical protein OC845_002644 [Tilletia horrida]|nr:hypothetical protein OC845_002644 [Tilletia horrida]
MVSNDPNFPDTGLQIKPSNDNSNGEWDVKDSQEDIETFGIAGRVWEAAYAARRFFSEASRPDGALEVEPTSSLFETSTTPQSINIVELGAGAGYGGLHLSKCLHEFLRRSRPEELQGGSRPRPRIILTDLPNVMPLMERNIAQAVAADDQLSNAMDIQAKPCAWGDEPHATAILQDITSDRVQTSQDDTPEQRLSHILAADLVYFPELFPPLLRSLIWLSEPSSSSSTSPEVFFTYKVRSLVKEQSFWMVFCAWFQCEPVYCRPRVRDPNKEAPQWRRFGERRSDLILSPAAASSVDASEDEDEADQQVFVFIARRKPHTLGWRPAEDDGALMQGQRHKTDDATGEELTERELDDTFEMILMNSVML